MRKSIIAAIAFGAATLTSGAAFASDPGLPWCLVHAHDYMEQCDYPNFASCQATASGVGYCTPNPAFFSSNQQAWAEAYGNPYGLPPPPPPRRKHRHPQAQ